MLNGDRESRPPVEAVPDIIASPPDSKKAKLDPSPDSDKSEKNDSNPAEDVKVSDSASQNTGDSPGAGPSTRTLPDQKGGVQQDESGDGEMSFSLQPPTPEATASSLPVVERLEEEWTACHMVWRGTIYDFKVEANDL